MLIRNSISSLAALTTGSAGTTLIGPDASPGIPGIVIHMSPSPSPIPIAPPPSLPRPSPHPQAPGLESIPIPATIAAPSCPTPPLPPPTSAGAAAAATSPAVVAAAAAAAAAAAGLVSVAALSVPPVAFPVAGAAAGVALSVPLSNFSSNRLGMHRDRTGKQE
ncbi:unnamed protein product [Closterium sp. NIES-53]